MRLGLGLLVAVMTRLAWPGPVAAQALRGTVLLPDSTPAASVIIVVGGAGPAPAVTRALTNSRGEFALSLPGPGRYTVRVLRIGYQPTTGPTVDVSTGDTTALRVMLTASPVMLSAMNVRAPGTCRVGADTGLMVARVWEEARKAMLTTQLGAGGERPLMAEWIEYDRSLDSTSRRVRDQRVHTTRSPTTHAFRSRPAEVLASEGYVIKDRTGTTFFAPDAEVLLSDVFAVSHCFRVERDPATHPGEIGVAFQPTRERRDRREIAGVFWLDEKNAELRTLEFRYTNLPDAAQPVEPGGVVEFLRLPEGDWLVSRWSIRMPQLAMPRKSSDVRRTLKASASPELRGVQIRGGEVVRLTRGDSLLYQLTGAEVAVQVLQRDTLVRARGAKLELDGTDYAASADTSGRIELWPVLRGRYHARVHTALMDSLGMPPVELDVSAVPDAPVDTVRLPRTRTVVRFAVTEASGAPLSDVTLEVQPANGPMHSVVTPKDGRVTLSDASPGRAVLRARRIGYQPGEVELSIAPGRNDITVVLSQAALPELDTVRVIARAVAARLQGFEDRRARHVATVSITRDDILKRNPVDAWQMLTHVPSLRIVENDSIVLAVSSRSPIVSLKNDQCFVPIAVDGVVLNPSPASKGYDLRDLPRPDEIHGIEVFAGPASVPLQFDGSSHGRWCGLIAIWTR